MASKRQRGGKWEYVVKRAGVLEKPLYLTFRSEAEGDAYCRNLEALLDRGIVPQEHRTPTRVMTLQELVDTYCRDHVVKQRDIEVLRTVTKASGSVLVSMIDAQWVDGWIEKMKRVENLAPATIRSKVGALARCTDWAQRKKLITLHDQPLRNLPEGYASYTAVDAALSGGAKQDEERDRRLTPDEERAIRTVLQRGVLDRKQRPLVLTEAQDLTNLFDLALETAMRLREMYSLYREQISLQRRTVFLDKTKNGDKRQVPLSSRAVTIVTSQLAIRDSDRLFPWDKGSDKLTSNYLSKLYAEVFEAAGCPDLRFHDLRHEATSRLFERTQLTVEQVMKITGHRSHRMMMRYLNLRGSDLADLLE